MNEARRYPRIGILGGMGPLSGVLLQKLIIDATPAKKDQDHIEVLSFTQPHIPARTASLAQDGGLEYVAAIRKNLPALVRGGATTIVIPCNTAYARLTEIQEGCEVPILDMIQLTLNEIRAGGKKSPIGLLATDGTVSEGIYHRRSGFEDVRWVLPGEESQKRLMEIIYEIKGGCSPESVDTDLRLIVDELKKKGAKTILLGCTELSLCFDLFEKEGATIIDPLRITAKRIVDRALYGDFLGAQ